MRDAALANVVLMVLGVALTGYQIVGYLTNPA
jgi:hypothetical protein